MLLQIAGFAFVDTDHIMAERALSVDELESLLGNTIFASPVLDIAVLVLVGVKSVLANSEVLLVIALGAVDDAIEGMCTVALIQYRLQDDQDALLRIHFNVVLAATQGFRKVDGIKGHMKCVVFDDGATERIILWTEVILKINRPRNRHEGRKVAGTMNLIASFNHCVHLL